MTRRLLAFFAPGMLMAQEITPHYTVGRFRPLNGQCPQCGTMAEKYIYGASSTQEAFYPGDAFGSMGRSNDSRLVTCHFCRNVFSQWAEGKEPINAK